VHYEEGTYHKSVVDCFSNLASDFGPRFALGSKNLALDVIEILGWRSYRTYEIDMTTLHANQGLKNHVAAGGLKEDAPTSF
jgi:hypothetical protein